MVGNVDLALVLDPEAGNSQLHCQAKPAHQCCKSGVKAFLSNSQNAVSRGPVITAPWPEDQVSGPQSTSLNTPLLGTTLLLWFCAKTGHCQTNQGLEGKSFYIIKGFFELSEDWYRMKGEGEEGSYKLDHPPPVLAGQCRDGLTLSSTLLPKSDLQFILPTLLMSVKSRTF